MSPLVALALLSPLPQQGPIVADFKDPKGVNAVSIATDGAMEPFFGMASGVSGKLRFDPANPEATTGDIIVKTQSIKLPLPELEESMKAEWCLDAERYPDIVFSIDKISDVKKTGNRYEGTVAGRLTLHGVTKPLTTTASTTYLAGKAKERFGDKPGDLLVVRCDFEFNRLDFGIGKGLSEQLVSNMVKVRVAIVGTALHP